MCLGVPGQIVAISDADKCLGIVSVAGVRREINLACIADPQQPIDTCIGDWVLVHVGFAMSRIDAGEAARTLQLLMELGEMQAELEAFAEAAGTVADQAPPPPVAGAAPADGAAEADARAAALPMPMPMPD